MKSVIPSEVKSACGKRPRAIAAAGVKVFRFLESAIAVTQQNDNLTGAIDRNDMTECQVQVAISIEVAHCHREAITATERFGVDEGTGTLEGAISVAEEQLYPASAFDYQIQLPVAIFACSSRAEMNVVERGLPRSS